MIERSRTVPLYKQVQLLLQDKILLGEMGPGVLMPTEQQLCEQYHVSRITIRKALEELERSDLIERVQGKGSIVKKRSVTRSQSTVLGHTKSMLRLGETPYSKLLDEKLIVGNPSLLELFHLPVDGTYYFWHFRRLRFFRGEPLVIMNNYVRKELGDIMLQYDLNTASFYSLYEQILNQQLYDSEALFTAIQASPENARLLKVNVGYPLLWYRGVTYLEGRITVEVNYSVYVGDKLQFEAHWFRPRGINSGGEEIT